MNALEKLTQVGRAFPRRDLDVCKRFVPITAKNAPMAEIITSVWLEAVRTHIFVLGHHRFP